MVAVNWISKYFLTRSLKYCSLHYISVEVAIAGSIAQFLTVEVAVVALPTQFLRRLRFLISRSISVEVAVSDLSFAVSECLRIFCLRSRGRGFGFYLLQVL